MRTSPLLVAAALAWSSPVAAQQPAPPEEAAQPQAAPPSPPPASPPAPAPDRAEAREPSPEPAAPAPAPSPAPQPREPRLPSPRIPGAAPTAPPAAEEPPARAFGSDVEAVAYEARLFFLDVLASDAQALASRAAFPFYLEDRRFDREDELFSEWLRNLRDKRTDLLTLYGIEVLTLQEMERKYGKPPARLSSVPLRTGKTLIAVGNLSGRAAVAVFRQVGNRWKIVAFHD